MTPAARLRAYRKDLVSTEPEFSWRKWAYKWLGALAVGIVLALYGVWFVIQFLFYQPPFQGN